MKNRTARMIQTSLTGLLWLYAAASTAATPAKTPDWPCFKPVLNEVYYQTSAEKWVSASTAEITVSVNASLNEAQLAKAHGLITQKLNQIAPGPWQIIQFDRTPNDSGLEQLHIRAQVRLPESAVSDIREKAKKISQPGETFKVDSLLFQPTLDETNLAKKQLRTEIYNQIQTELTSLNALYPSQHYTVHSIRFYENNLVLAKTPRLLSMAAAPQSGENAGASGGDSAVAPIANKLQLSADIVLAAASP